MPRTNVPIQDLIDLHNQGLYDREIAEIIGTTRHNVCQRLNNAGIKNRKSKINDIALRNRISNTLKGRYVGDKNPNYKGYKNETTIARGLFKTISKEMIRNSGYYCHICGKKSQVYHTHHIKPFALIFKEFFERAYSGNIENLVHELMNYEDFTNRKNLIVCCKDCHYAIHYTDNPELSPYRWESATTIESTQNVEASRVGSSDPKREASQVDDDIVSSL